jgi:hypothetical protein
MASMTGVVWQLRHATAACTTWPNGNSLTRDAFHTSRASTRLTAPGSGNDGGEWQAVQERAGASAWWHDAQSRGLRTLTVRCSAPTPWQTVHGTASCRACWKGRGSPARCASGPAPGTEPPAAATPAAATSRAATADPTSCDRQCTTCPSLIMNCLFGRSRWAANRHRQSRAGIPAAAQPDPCVTVPAGARPQATAMPTAECRSRSPPAGCSR